MADIKEPISITDKVLKEGSGDVNKLVRFSHTHYYVLRRNRLDSVASLSLTCF